MTIADFDPHFSPHSYGFRPGCSQHQAVQAAQRIADKRILRLVGVMLRSGVMINGVVNPSKEGAMQGGPLSPLLSNIVLDELDQELEKRGLAFSWFADDCNIFVSSQKAAERVMDKVSQFIENKLKLKVNREKSQVAKSDAVKFLGFTVVDGTIAIAHKALQTAMSKVKALSPRCIHQALAHTIADLKPMVCGLGQLLQPDSISIPVGEDRSPYTKTITG